MLFIFSDEELQRREKVVRDLLRSWTWNLNVSLMAMVWCVAFLFWDLSQVSLTWLWAAVQLILIAVNSSNAFTAYQGRRFCKEYLFFLNYLKGKQNAFIRNSDNQEAD
jgi:hypothetical protein